VKIRNLKTKHNRAIAEMTEQMTNAEKERINFFTIKEEEMKAEFQATISQLEAELLEKNLVIDELRIRLNKLTQ
jgi:hypothetical protein